MTRFPSDPFYLSLPYKVPLKLCASAVTVHRARQPIGGSCSFASLLIALSRTSLSYTLESMNWICPVRRWHSNIPLSGGLVTKIILPG